MSTFLQFGEAMLRRAARVESAAAFAVKTVVVAALSAVVRGTPVDTGQARSNWLVSLGAPDLTQRAPHSPYPRDFTLSGRRFGETANADAAIQAGIAKLAGRKSGQTVYVQNNVPYIRLLNDGRSRQAPRLFVQTAVGAGIRSLDGLKVFT